MNNPGNQGSTLPATAGTTPDSAKPSPEGKGEYLRRGEIAAFSDLAHRNGMLHVDLQSSLVRIHREDGYHATYDLNSGRLISVKSPV